MKVMNIGQAVEMTIMCVIHENDTLDPTKIREGLANYGMLKYAEQVEMDVDQFINNIKDQFSEAYDFEQFEFTSMGLELAITMHHMALESGVFESMEAQTLKVPKSLRELTFDVKVESDEQGNDDLTADDIELEQLLGILGEVVSHTMDVDTPEQQQAASKVVQDAFEQLDQTGTFDHTFEIDHTDTECGEIHTIKLSVQIHTPALLN